MSRLLRIRDVASAWMILVPFLVLMLAVGALRERTPCPAHGRQAGSFPDVFVHDGARST